MEKLVEVLGKTPLPTILVVAGILFLFFAVGGQLGARISTRRLRPVYAATLGGILLVIGIWLQLSASSSSEPKSGHGTSAPSGSESVAYSLRIPLQRGKTQRQEWKAEMPDGMVTIEQGSNLITGKYRYSQEWTTVTEIVAVDDRRPLVIRQAFRSDNRTSEITMEKQNPIVSQTKGPLSGETVLFEWKNGQWQKTLLGKQPTAEQQAELNQQQFVNPDDVYPKEKVVPGHTWQLKDQQLAHFLPNAFSIKGDASCTFERIEPYEGQECAVITQRVDAVFKMLFQNEEAEVLVGEIPPHIAHWKSWSTATHSWTRKW